MKLPKLNLGKKPKTMEKQILEETNIMETDTFDMPIPKTPEDLEQVLNTSSQETNEPTHFDDLIGEAEAAEESTIKTELLSLDDFRKSFKGIHSMTAAMSGIQSIALPNTHINDATADEIADTIYESIIDIPLLRPILMPGNVWFGRGFVMLAYVQGMRGAIRDEMRAKYIAKQEQNPTASYDTVKTASKKTKKNDDDLDPEQVAALVGLS